MKILLSLFFIAGFVLFLSFLTGCIFIFRKNTPLELKSAYSIYLAVAVLFYILSVVFVFAYSIFTAETSYFPYIIFALLPFLIGKITTFKMLKFYTGLQMFVILTGCVISYINLLTF